MVTRKSLLIFYRKKLNKASDVYELLRLKYAMQAYLYFFTAVKLHSFLNYLLVTNDYLALRVLALQVNIAT